MKLFLDKKSHHVIAAIANKNLFPAIATIKYKKILLKNICTTNDTSTLINNSYFKKLQCRQYV